MEEKELGNSRSGVDGKVEIDSLVAPDSYLSGYIPRTRKEYGFQNQPWDGKYVEVWKKNLAYRRGIRGSRNRCGDLTQWRSEEGKSEKSLHRHTCYWGKRSRKIKKKRQNNQKVGHLK